MSVALVGLGFKAGQRHPFTRLHPGADFGQCFHLMWQAFPLEHFEQRVVIRLRFQFPPLLGGDTQLRQMLLANADAFASLA